MSVIPCRQNDELQAKILEYAEILKTQAHRLGEHGLDELAHLIRDGSFSRLTSVA